MASAAHPLLAVGSQLASVPPADAKPHEGSGPDGGDEDDDDDPNCELGSILTCQNQGLGESAPIVGVPFALEYRSERVPARTAGRTLNIPR